MKPLTLLSICLLLSSSVVAQIDSVYKHSGEVIAVNVKEVTSFAVKYTFPGETVVQSIGKPAVERVKYASGRTEQVSEKIVIRTEFDFEKVQVLTHPDEATGLVPKGEVEGKTAGFLSYQTAGTAKKASMNRIRKAAAKLGAPFILMIETANVGVGVGLGSAQSIRNGTAYSYK